VQKQDQKARSALAVSFFDASEDCVKVIGLGGDLLAMNANGVCILEIDDFEALRGRPWSEMWPEHSRSQVEAAVLKATRGEGSKFSADCPTAKGTPKTWDVVVWPVFGETGEPIEVMSISRDVTETRRLEEQRALFTRELAHRIKNTFAVVDGLIAMSSKADSRAKSFADTLRERIAGLGRAISYIAPPEFVGLPSERRSLLGLLDVLLRPYGATEGAQRNIQVAGDDVSVGPEATTTLALVFNELATNALKYGGLGTPDGQLNIQTVANGSQISIVWTETGAVAGMSKMAPPDGRIGFGATLLERAIVRQLGGSLVRDWTGAGLVVRMTLPLARLAG
jgi:PAS domain S-box-containing protein